MILGKVVQEKNKKKWLYTERGNSSMTPFLIISLFYARTVYFLWSDILQWLTNLPVSAIQCRVLLAVTVTNVYTPCEAITSPP